MTITHLGEATFHSPIKRTVNDNLRVPEHIVNDINSPTNSGLQFELAGPREKLFFDPKKTKQEL